MFGHGSLPSRIYSYGALEPTQGGEFVRDEMWRAHRYRNSLVEIERKRRDQAETAVAALSPRLVEINAKIGEEQKALEQLRAAMSKANAKARRRLLPKGSVDEATSRRERIRALLAERKSLRKELFASTQFENLQTRLDAEDLTVRHAARAESGLYWGTYGVVEVSMARARSGAPPRFMAFRGDGHLAVNVKYGLSQEEAEAGGDKRIQIARVVGVGKSDAKRRIAMIRLGSLPGGVPLWVAVPFTMHRPLPDGSRIKSVHLIRRRIGTHDSWSVQFVVSRKAGFAPADRAVEGTVGIDINWRMRDDGSLRVAFWIGSDGAEGEVSIPAGWLREMKRVRGIRSHRDEAFDEAKARLVAWMRTRTDLPEWLVKETETLPQWRSCGRFAALAMRWRAARFAGDVEAFDALEAWRERDRHLFDFEANLRDQLLKWREHAYRNVAARLRRRYRKALLEDFDLRTAHAAPKPEDESVDGALREHVRDACLSQLRRCILESMAETARVDRKGTSERCPECGIHTEIGAEVMRTCSGCGKVDDRDRVAARNILGASQL